RDRSDGGAAVGVTSEAAEHSLVRAAALSHPEMSRRRRVVHERAALLTAHKSSALARSSTRGPRSSKGRPCPRRALRQAGTGSSTSRREESRSPRAGSDNPSPPWPRRRLKLD